MAHAGQRISEYVLEDRLGAGAFGEVWKARHHAWHGTVVAVKLPNDGELIRQLQREGLAVQGLDHPNIVKPLGFDGAADPPYLVSEFVDGENLRGPIARRAFSPAQAIALVRQVLAALAYAHGRGIVHRDVKPENILIGKDGAAKLVDFGLVQASTAAGAASALYSLSIDGPRAGAIAGTLDYMSPEQRAGGPVDGRADLYAVAVVLFELLTGEKPAGHDTPHDLNPKVPAYLDDVFRRGYARLDRRFASAAEFAAALGPVPPQLPARAVAPRLPAAKATPAVAQACPRCRRPTGPGDQFCMHCGVQLQAIVRRCARCGAYPDARDDFCLRCGDAVGRLRLAVDRSA